MKDIFLKQDKEEQINFKWKKIRLLCLFNLMDQMYIDKTIRRFNIRDKNICKSIELDMLHNKHDYNYTYVIVMVSCHHQYMLPNYVIKIEEDLGKLQIFLSENLQKGYQEIWCFRNNSSQTILSGRISFENGASNNQIIEITGNESPRGINQTIANNFYVRAERIEWGRRYHINTLYSTDKYQYDLVAGYINKTFLEIERKRELLQNTEEFFYISGIRSFSFDFILNKSSLQIIDWDTNNDKAFLVRL